MCNVLLTHTQFQYRRSRYCSNRCSFSQNIHFIGTSKKLFSTNTYYPAISTSDSATLPSLSYSKLYSSSYNISFVSSPTKDSDAQLPVTFTSRQYINESSKINTNSKMTSAMVKFHSVTTCISPSLIDSINDHTSSTSMITIQNINTNTVSQSDHQMMSTVVTTPRSNSQ